MKLREPITIILGISLVIGIWLGAEKMIEEPQCYAGAEKQLSESVSVNSGGYDDCSTITERATFHAKALSNVPRS